MFWNSTYYTVLTVIITITISSLSGYVFARGGNFPGSKVIFTVFSSLMFINMGSITIYAVFTVTSTSFSLSDWLLGTYCYESFRHRNCDILYLVRSYIRTLPYSLDEAGKDLTVAVL